MVVENFRAGTMERLGYGWEALHARFPRLIYAACSGFGHTGPYAGRPAYDVVVQAMGGIMSLTGQPGGPPARVGSSVGDIVAGLFTAIGINGALYRRTMTGRRHEARRLHARLPGGDPGERARALLRVRRGAGAAGDTPSLDQHPSRPMLPPTVTSSSPPATTRCSRRSVPRWSRPDLAEDARFADNAARNANIDALEAGVRGDPDGRTRPRTLAHGAGGGRRAVLADQQGG